MGSNILASYSTKRSRYRLQSQHGRDVVLGVSEPETLRRLVTPLPSAPSGPIASPAAFIQRLAVSAKIKPLDILPMYGDTVPVRPSMVYPTHACHPPRCEAYRCRPQARSRPGSVPEVDRVRGLLGVDVSASPDEFSLVPSRNTASNLSVRCAWLFLWPEDPDL